jgi:hypothetical protein
MRESAVGALPLAGRARVQSSRPALTCISGARRARTVPMISSVSMPAIGARRGHIRMPEPPLDDRQRHTLPRELDSVRMTKLVRREPTGHTGRERVPAQLSSHSRRRPRPPARWPVDHAEQRAHGQLGPTGEPWRDVVAPRQGIHPDLPALVALPVLRRIRHNPRRMRIAPRRGSRSDSISDSASWIRSPPRHSMTIRARSLIPRRSDGVLCITATISSTVGGSAG